MLKNIDETKAYLEEPQHNETIVTLKRTKYITTRLPIEQDEPSALFTCAAHHATRCRKLGIGTGIELTTSYKITTDSSADESHINDFYLCTFLDAKCSTVSEEEQEERSAGTYFEVIYKLTGSGDEYSILDTISQIPRFIKAKARDLGYSLANDIYVHEIGHYQEKDERGILLRLQVRVKEEAT